MTEAIRTDRVAARRRAENPLLPLRDGVAATTLRGGPLAEVAARMTVTGADSTTTAGTRPTSARPTFRTRST